MVLPRGTALSLVPGQPAPCALEGGLTLFHPDTAADAASCWRPPFEFVKSCAVALVVTWSSGSSGAASGKDYAGLLRLASFKTDPTVAMVAYGKGSPCDAMPSPLRAWERALCISGRNVGAREAHSILHFATAFYDHLPQAAYFLQDDAHVESLRGLMHDGGMGGWAHALMADALARQRVGGAPSDPPQPEALATHWGPPPCGWVAGLRALSPLELSRANGAPPCDWGGKVVAGENFTEVSYGGYRPMAWFLRTFFADFANVTQLPSTIVWPGGAQFAVARPAVRSRPLAFWSTLLALASPHAPLKHEVPRQPNATDKAHARSAKWANFGPVVVDLGPIKETLPLPADSRPGMNGMDFAQALTRPPPRSATLTPKRQPQLPNPCPRPLPLYTVPPQMCERLWFRIFDPALKPTLPPFPECYTAEALALGPVRCATGQCPSDFALRRPYPGGCELTDRAGVSTPPPDWRYARGENHCMAVGCRG